MSIVAILSIVVAGTWVIVRVSLLSLTSLPRTTSKNLGLFKSWINKKKLEGEIITLLDLLLL